MGIFPSCRMIPSVREDPSLLSHQEKFPLFLVALRQSSRREFPGSAQIPDSPALFCLLEVQIFPGKCGNRLWKGQEHFLSTLVPFPWIFFFLGGDGLFLFSLPKLTPASGLEPSPPGFWDVQHSLHNQCSWISKGSYVLGNGDGKIFPARFGMWIRQELIPNRFWEFPSSPLPFVLFPAFVCAEPTGSTLGILLPGILPAFPISRVGTHPESPCSSPVNPMACRKLGFSRIIVISHGFSYLGKQLCALGCQIPALLIFLGSHGSMPG